MQSTPIKRVIIPSMDAAPAATSVLPVRTGHSISNVGVGDNARAHMGDN